MSKLSRLATLLCALLLVAAPASAGIDPVTGEWVPEYVETPTYMHCTGETKVGNVHAIADSQTVSFDENAPTTSYTAGGGCGTADTFLEGTADHNRIYDFTTSGYYTGNIDTVTIRLWAIETAGKRLNDFLVNLHLKIDGEDVLKRGTVGTAVAVPSSTGLTRLYEVTVTDVGLSTELDSTYEHDVVLTVYPQGPTNTGSPIAWVYDATEIDSGLIFNDTTPAQKTIARNVPRS